jgi:uncharacterized SAM-binding protein YcdF (DUF218 family)
MSPPTRSRCLIRLALALLLLAGAIAAMGAYATSRAGYWLAAPARPPAPADAIVVLGGDDGGRLVRGLELYRGGYAPTIVLTGIEHGRRATRSAYLTWRAEFLVRQGVPRSALRYDTESDNSYEEATNVRSLMEKQRWRSVLVVSDPPHMRRLSWTWERVFRDTGLHYVLVASEPDWWSPGDWWRDEKSGAFVLMEYIKLAYYIARR